MKIYAVRFSLFSTPSLFGLSKIGSIVLVVVVIEGELLKKKMRDI